MSMPAYGEYKASGVTWIGDIPKNWEISPLKRHVRLLTEKSGSRLRPIALENIEGWSGRFIETETDFQGDGVAFEANDILFGKLRPYLAKVLLVKQGGEAVGDFHVLRVARSLFPRYAQYQMLQREFIHVIDGSTFGSKMPRANWESLGGMPFVIPEHHEQEAIAAFLDRETAKIDALIAKQETLLSLLAEKRQATISHAVTRGLDPDVQMKDSGISWLGEMPGHWAIHSFRREICEGIANGIFKKKDEFGAGTLLVNVFDIYRPDFKIDCNRLDRVVCTDDEIEAYRVEAGNLLFVRSSLKLEGIGVVAVAESSDEPLVYECHLIRARLKADSFDGRFASYLFNSTQYRQHLIRSAKVTTMTTIDQEAILSVPVLVPPLVEQRALVEFIDAEVGKIDFVDFSTKEVIRILKERRSAMIAAAVTGKIDVRDLAA